MRETGVQAQQYKDEIEFLNRQVKFKEAEIRRLQQELNVANDMYQRVCDNWQSRSTQQAVTKYELQDKLLTNNMDAFTNGNIGIGQYMTQERYMDQGRSLKVQ